MTKRNAMRFTTTRLSFILIAIVLLAGACSTAAEVGAVGDQSAATNDSAGTTPAVVEDTRTTATVNPVEESGDAEEPTAPASPTAPPATTSATDATTSAVGDVSALAGAVLGSCNQVDLDQLGTVFGVDVFVVSDNAPVSPYRSCAIYGVDEPDVQLGEIHASPDLDGAKYRLEWTDRDRFVAADDLVLGATTAQGLFTTLRVEDGGAELEFSARIYNGGFDFGDADLARMADLVPHLAGAFGEREVTAELPAQLQTCDDVPIADFNGDQIGDWTSASYEGLLHCVAPTGAGNLVSVVVGALDSTADAVDWVNQRTDTSLEATSFALAYPIAYRDDNVDVGYGSFGERFLTDYTDIINGDDVKGDSAVGSHGRFVAWFSIQGPIADGDGDRLYTSDLARFLGVLLDGVESDYDPAVYEEDVDAVVADFFAGDVPSLSGIGDELDECAQIDTDNITDLVEFKQVGQDAEGGWFDNDGRTLFCGFYELDASGDANVGFSTDLLSIEVWDGTGEEPWSDWQVEDLTYYEEEQYTLRYYGAGWDIASIFFRDESGIEVRVEMENRRTNPVTMAELLDVLAIAVDGMQ